MIEPIDRIYTVYVKRGHIRILVRWKTIENLGEREAVAEKAWMHLRGQNELGEFVSNPVTRQIIYEETMSRYEGDRWKVFKKFKETINFEWVGVSRDGTI